MVRKYSICALGGDRAIEPGQVGSRKEEEEMHRRNVHRRIAVLALVTALALAGARPAAAVQVGFLNHLSAVWSAVTARPAALWDKLVGWVSGADKVEKSSTPLLDPPPTSDQSMGLDPNGNS
jgi:hypothetical protein